MSKKSFAQLTESFKKQGYKFSIFSVETIGNYSPEDSDWNYKDVIHLNVIHTNVSGINAVVLNELQGSINFQKLPFFGIMIPLTVINYEFSKFNQIYVTTFGPFILAINTISSYLDEKKAKITTTYAIGSRGLLKFFHPIIKKSLTKNYKLLMSEDGSMRNRRGELRNCGHLFYSQNETYSFTSSEEIHRANVYLERKSDSYIAIKKSTILSAKDEEKLGKPNGICSFFITHEDNGVRKLWPTTCVHEGAPMNKKCIHEGRLLCPWHRRKTDPLLILDKKDFIKIIPSIDYAVKEDNELINIRYRNEPQYYNKRPYKFFRYDD